MNKKFIPKFLRRVYHLIMAVLAAYWYRFPARELTVVGVTGTDGKTTTVNLAARVLGSQGEKVAWMTTANFGIGKKVWLNRTKQTMQGRFRLEKFLREAVSVGCKFAVIEVSSEGIAQYRHWGIEFDVAVFTNLSLEHIESHGSFEAYRSAKGELFASLGKPGRKKGPKTSIINLDDPEADFFLKFPAGQKIGYGKEKAGKKVDLMVWGEDIVVGIEGLSLEIVAGEEKYRLSTKMIGQFNAYNLMAAAGVGLAVGRNLAEVVESLEGVSGVAGRMEVVPSGEDFLVVVDYAHAPAALENVYQTLRPLIAGRMIVVLGSQGGGRDKAKRPKLGILAGEYADLVVVTNEDPYDDEPMKIINEVAAGARERGKEEGKNLWSILDRREGIKKALDLARAGDAVIISGKGCEQCMVVAGGKKIPWDDRKVVTELLEEREG